MSLEGSSVPFDVGMVVLPFIVYVIVGIIGGFSCDAVKDVTAIFGTVGNYVGIRDIRRVVSEMPFDTDIGCGIVRTTVQRPTIRKICNYA